MKLPRYVVFKINFYIAYLAFIVVMVAWPLKLLLCHMFDESYSGFLMQMVAVLANVIVVISLVTTWIFRIRIELRDTRYEVPKWQNDLMLIVYSIGVTSAVLGIFGLTVSWTIESISLLDESAMILCFAAITLLTVSVMFLIVFSRTLKDLTLQRRKMGQIRGHEDQTPTPGQYAPGDRIDPDAMEIQDKIMKYAGLSFIGLLSAFVSCLFKALVVLFEDEEGSFEDGIQLVSWINSVDSLVNFSMLFFQYGFAATYYYLWCRCVDQCFAKCTDRKVNHIILSSHEYTVPEISDDSEHDLVQQALSGGDEDIVIL